MLLLASKNTLVGNYPRQGLVVTLVIILLVTITSTILIEGPAQHLCHTPERGHTKSRYAHIKLVIKITVRVPDRQESEPGQILSSIDPNANCRIAKFPNSLPIDASMNSLWRTYLILQSTIDHNRGRYNLVYLLD